jgi:hypothetical protein
VEFTQNYGWAYIIPQKERSFKTIQTSVEMGHMNSWYKLACNNVHSGPKSIHYRLGLINNTKNNLILAGPSNYGLADPGQSCALSLVQISTCLFLLKPNYDRIVLCNVLNLFVNEISESFITLQKEIEEEELSS